MRVRQVSLQERRNLAGVEGWICGELTLVGCRFLQSCRSVGELGSLHNALFLDLRLQLIGVTVEAPRLCGVEVSERGGLSSHDELEVVTPLTRLILRLVTG